MSARKISKAKNSLLYLAICSRSQSPGVIKKIKGVVSGAKACGYDSRSVIIEPGKLISYVLFIYNIAFAKEKYVFIRYINVIGIWILFSGFILKIRGRDLFIDVPTPIKNHLREICGSPQTGLVEFVNVLLIFLQGSLPFLSAKKVVQYAEEGKFFSLGVERKTIKIGNGVDVESIPCRSSAPKWPSLTLNLVAVGTIAFWHGWDKLIEAIRIVGNDPEVDFNINLSIIGDGPDRIKLEQLVSSYNLSNNIKFTGLLYGKELYEEYNKAHFGVSSLGWSRVGIYEASPLKVREYLAAGLPVIAATKDPDFNNNDSIVINLADEGSVDNIVKFIRNISLMKIPSVKECRLFAENNLDFKIKMKKVLQS